MILLPHTLIKIINLSKPHFKNIHVYRGLLKLIENNIKAKLLYKSIESKN